VSYALDWEPLTLMGRLFGARLARQAGEVVGKRILEAVAFAKGARATYFDLAPPELPQGARERAAALAAEIDRSPYGNGLGRPLADRVLGAMATDLQPIKPKPLARELDVPQRDAIEGCLAGVRAGLLTMKWDLLCTNCRGAKISTSVLSELPRGAHCPSCNIDYGRDFEKNVELSFAPAPTVRPLSAGGFCLSGPMATPHVAVQLLLAPGETRNVKIDLPPGSYRLRTLHPGDHVDVEHAGGAFPGLRITASGVEATPPGEAGMVAFANDSGFELAALIEDRTWTRDALTAPEVISLQVFRDLFAEATLRPGDEAGVSQVALLFSDLQGSTALYERVGDAVAFNMVREHFALLAGVVRDHDGAVVKTIGDAVMASFGDPADAVKAALAMQARIADHDLVLKLGVHVGPSVVVTLNDRLDYFGSTVNMAARLQGQSEGGDIVLSRAVADDPAVRPLLAARAARDESVPLKGFADPISFVRLLPGTTAA
jgi:class 3 adenylate cyclase